jgi:hypothetical protein
MKAIKTKFVCATLAGLALASIDPVHATTTILLSLSVDPSLGTISYGTTPVQTYVTYGGGAQWPIQNGVGYVNTFTYTGTFGPITLAADPLLPPGYTADIFEVAITFDTPLSMPVPTAGGFGTIAQWEIVTLSISGPNFPALTNQFVYGAQALIVNDIQFVTNSGFYGGPWVFSHIVGLPNGPIGPYNPYSDHIDPITELSDTYFLGNNPSIPNSLTVDTFTITVQAAAAAPEIPTWAMMLIGFAGLGFAFRQSQRKASFA